MLTFLNGLGVASPGNLPPRFQGAMQIIQMLNNKVIGETNMATGDKSPGISLGRKEQAVYDAACQIAQQYLLGESDLADVVAPSPAVLENSYGSTGINIVGVGLFAIPS